MLAIPINCYLRRAPANIEVRASFAARFEAGRRRVETRILRILQISSEIDLRVSRAEMSKVEHRVLGAGRGGRAAGAEERGTSFKGDAWLLGEHRLLCGDAMP
jgi:hypothetical protein